MDRSVPNHCGIIERHVEYDWSPGTPESTTYLDYTNTSAFNLSV